MNEQNLRVPSSSEARENGRKGGLTRAANAARFKEMQLRALAYLSAPSPKNPDCTVLDELIGGLTKEGIAGNANAAEKVLQMAGLSPTLLLKQEDQKIKREELKLKKAEAERKNPETTSGPTVLEQMVRELYERPDGEAEEIHD